MPYRSRVPLIAACILYACLANAQRLTLATLLGQIDCSNAECMDRFAMANGFCQKATNDPTSWLWFTCEHLREGAMDVRNGTGLVFLSEGDGKRGYIIQTCDEAYAQALTEELDDLGFKELKSLPNGAAYASRKYKGVELLKTARPLGGGMMNWGFTIVVK